MPWPAQQSCESSCGVSAAAVNDRIDRRRDGSGALAVIDYKTGKPPAARKVHALDELQVLLYAAAAEVGTGDRLERFRARNSSDPRPSGTNCNNLRTTMDRMAPCRTMT